MNVIGTVAEIRRQVDGWRREGRRIGLVPTMGYFHEGHLALMRWAKAHCDRVVTSLFVNPIQFGPNEDLDAYPRDFERDRRLAEEQQVDVLFCPEAAEMYGADFQTTVRVDRLSKGLCGANRPGHFDGVATVVTKLFNLVKPHVAVFGQKDFQQLALISQLVRDLNLDIEIFGHPIVREADGLAMSSRNTYLNDDERQIATCLYEALQKAREMVRDHGGAVAAEQVERVARETIECHSQCTVDYASVVHRQSLSAMETANADSVLALAVKISEKVRLIDNAPLADE